MLWVDEQRRDDSLWSLIDFLSSNLVDPSCRFYHLQDGTLYRRNLFCDGHKLLPVVPKQLCLAIFQPFHDPHTAGHLGVAGSYDGIKRPFFWPCLYHTVKRYVNACETCQHRKKPTSLPAGLLQPLDVSSEPLFRVGLDILGPFRTSTADIKWVAVATDYAT